MMCAHRERSGCFEFVFILHFSFDVVSVILRGESYCCLVNVYNLMAHANETVVLALILFFFVCSHCGIFIVCLVHFCSVSLHVSYMHSLGKLTRLACYVQSD